MTTDWTKVRWFRVDEFDSRDAPGSGSRMQAEIVYVLDCIRTMYGKPIIVNSGYRTVAHNTAVGGETNSAHLRGYAVDLALGDSAARMAIVRWAYALGIKRIGVGGRIVHLDADPSLPQNVMWLY